MTPEARLAAAAEILDHWLAGEPAEKLLTGWARRSRFAGSGDRAAVRDHVFDAIRRRRSAAWLGGAETGRGLVIGLLRANGLDPAAFLTGAGHALAPLTAEEAVEPAAPSGNVALDCPDWLEPELRASLGSEFAAVMELLQQRAGLFLRVNLAKGDRSHAIARLSEEGILCRPHALCETALLVQEGARKVRNTEAYATGLIEIQDAASQAVAAAVPLPEGGRVLDYCAGGGGKALALAARSGREILVHDGKPERMSDLATRATRAGARLRPVDAAGVAALAPFDLVLADVPCSGSGAWRRQPEAKWRLTEARLAEIRALQREILVELAPRVAPGGVIAYMTCSLLESENGAQVAWFHSAFDGWQTVREDRLSPLAGGDGFFIAILRRSA